MKCDIAPKKITKLRLYVYSYNVSWRFGAVWGLNIFSFPPDLISLDDEDRRRSVGFVD